MCCEGDRPAHSTRECLIKDFYSWISYHTVLEDAPWIQEWCGQTRKGTGKSVGGEGRANGEIDRWVMGGGTILLLVLIVGFVTELLRHDVPQLAQSQGWPFAYIHITSD